MSLIVLKETIIDPVYSELCFYYTAKIYKKTITPIQIGKLKYI